ncbi:MAG: hypothetical protein IT467_03230, partial [Dokdonella sp.]|nr:hypothetical protein [Dokdonella sp.]
MHRLERDRLMGCDRENRSPQLRAILARIDGDRVEDHGYLHHALILLLATVLIVPLAKRWRLGAVLGYLG